MMSWTSRTAVGPGKALNSSKAGLAGVGHRAFNARPQVSRSPRTSEVGGKRERVRFGPFVEVGDGVPNHSAELSETRSAAYASMLFQRPRRQAQIGSSLIGGKEPVLRGEYRSLGHVVTLRRNCGNAYICKNTIARSRFYDEASIWIHGVVNRQLSVEG